MKKPWTASAFIALFLILSLIPIAALPIVGEAEPIANEIPAARPKLFDADGVNTDFAAQLTDYVATRFAFRESLVSLWSELNARLLNSSAQEKLILGKQGWLFYSETLADYMGLGLFDGQIQSAANNLSLIQEYAEGCGIDFLFAVAPNKNSLYPEYMPDRIEGAHSASNAARLLPMLRDAGVNCIDLFSAFEGQGVLYYAGDSHWTTQGAALAADSMLLSFGRDSTFFQANYSLGEATHTGDLFEMLYPTGVSAERETVGDTDFSFTCLDDPAGGNAMNIYTENPKGQGSLLCFRDSFGIALYPYLAQSYQSAHFTRAADYDLTGLADSGADTLIIELVERNLHYLVDRPPCLPAPQRELAAERSGEGAAAITRSEGKADGFAQFRGELSASMVDGGSRIYLRAGDRVYEAFALRAAEGTGFSAWLPAGESVDAVLCIKGGSLTSYNTISE